MKIKKFIAIVALFAAASLGTFALGVDQADAGWQRQCTWGHSGNYYSSGWSCSWVYVPTGGWGYR